MYLGVQNIFTTKDLQKFFNLITLHYKRFWILSAGLGLFDFNFEASKMFLKGMNQTKPKLFNSQRFLLSTNASNLNKPILEHPPTQTAAPAERPSKRVTIHTLKSMKQNKQKITMVTAYDYPSAVHVDVADIDVLLCGDSVGMVELGHDTTLPVTMDDMVHHCKAVSRGCRRPLLVGDLPFGSYEHDSKEAFKNAARLLKEGGMDAVKLEGGRHRVEAIRTIVTGGIACFGHIGLTPQQFSALGGFRYQGRTAEQALSVLKDAIAVQEAGAFAVVIECVPASVAREITARLEIPTIGIGSGPYVDGQVLVYHDLLGMMQHPWHAAHVLKFCKMYAAVGSAINVALAEYRDEVRSGQFPGMKFSPYQISQQEEELFMKNLAEKFDKERQAVGSSFDNKYVSQDDSMGSLYGSAPKKSGS
jgi:3-methyl-2-oxobutanoate hydroxymethyltransferase